MMIIVSYLANKFILTPFLFSIYDGHSKIPRELVHFGAIFFSLYDGYSKSTMNDLALSLLELM